MSEGVYEISDGFEDDEPDAIKNTDIDDQLYANVRAFKPSPRDGVVASDGVIGHHDSKLREQLQTSYNTLTKERDQLQTSYNTLTKERDQLQTSYSTLTKEQDKIQTNYNTMTKERDQLQTERDVLSGWLTSLKQTCPERWQKFESSWYFLSTETKTWKESREDCLQRGADLVIINNNKEQEFLFNLNKRVWIGLTDSVTEGTWRWVDGTPLTTPRYWSSHQPDNGDGKPEYGVEDCVQIRKDQSPLEAWNDVSCRSKLNWVCEKVF
ncbi:CD209 antigen-like protein E isoform X4 [Oncorhynchus tshawytscha]|uniref:CD209 antigen-like protein E isoform X4 n=1 Tax=Oncorhynchus tshawytscha TaxID=74940 RepID=UPI001C3C43E5|nr:CD209 antigen-like protein E isoform X4 [Oncorhynchus tshawytscha]